jgi:hypothetical protein
MIMNDKIQRYKYLHRKVYPFIRVPKITMGSDDGDVVFNIEYRPYTLQEIDDLIKGLEGALRVSSKNRRSNKVMS